MRIAIEGNIGAGKTTCMNMIRDVLSDHNVVVVTEPLDVWTALPNPSQPAQPVNMLHEYYLHMRQTAFPLQILVQNSYAQKCQHMESTAGAADIVLTERTLPSSYHVFARVTHSAGIMNDAEYAVLTHHTNMMCEQFSRLLDYDLLIYLKCTPEQCLERIRRRARVEEQDLVGLDYLKQLHAAYDSWFDDDEGHRARPLKLGRFVCIDNTSASLDETRNCLVDHVKHHQQQKLLMTTA